MQHAAVLAIAVAVATGIAAFLVPRRVRPDVAVRLITALGLLSATAALWTMLLVLSANVVQLHGVAEQLAWCSDFVTRHRGTFTPVGVGALAAVFAAFFSATRTSISQRRLRAPAEGRDLVVVDIEEPVAYTIPGRPGTVLVSTAMLRALDPEERRVLLAHERAHLRWHHHRYIRLTRLATAAIPVLRPLNRRLRFAVERWADEDAACEVGDRTVVACAIAKAALASTPAPRVALAAGDTAVVQRVQHMLNGPPTTSPVISAALGSLIVAALGALLTSVLLIEPSVLAILGACH